MFTAIQKVKRMTTPIIFDGNEHREMTKAEHAQWEIDKVLVEAHADAKIAKHAARQAVLDKLGLTQDEAQALLG